MKPMVTIALSIGSMLRLTMVCSEMGDRDARHVLQGEDAVTGELVEEALLDHDAAPAAALLRRLEDEMHRALEIAHLGEDAGGAEQHGGVAVMAAGMHPTLMRRGMGKGIRLLHRQAIHVGAQADRTQRIAAPQRADDAGLGKATMDFAAIFSELRRDDVRGALFGEGELGMRVDV